MPCIELLSVELIVLNCADLIDVRQKYFTANSLQVGNMKGMTIPILYVDSEPVNECLPTGSMKGMIFFVS